jgi:hypothetical protein
MAEVLVIGPVVVEHLATRDGYRRELGGSGLTAALACAASGAETSLAGWVGSSEADEAIELLRAAAVDTSALAVLPGASGTFVVPDVIDASPPRPQYRPFETSPQTLARPALRFARLTLAFGTPDADPIAQGWLDAPGTETLVWDRQGWLSRARDARLAALVPAQQRVWVGNVDEARAESGATSDGTAFEAMPVPAFSTAIVKCGPWGVVVRTRDQGQIRETCVGAYPTPGRSSIGSGDAFAGAVAARMATGEDAETAAEWGCAVAATFVADPSNVVSAEVVERATQNAQTPGVFLDRRVLARLDCRVLCRDTPGGRLLRDAVCGVLRHLGFTPRTDQASRAADIIVTDAWDDPAVSTTVGGETLLIALVSDPAAGGTAIEGGGSRVVTSVEQLSPTVIGAVRTRLTRRA